jgi:hypothetical protein
MLKTPMTLQDFNNSLAADTPPEALPPLLLALWLEGNGNWKRAHEIAQDIDSTDAARVHAYLHRKEGDLWNARYWYRQAGVLPVTGSTDEEWLMLAAHLLQNEFHI